MEMTVQKLVGQTLYDKEHRKVGKIHDVYLDSQSDKPVFATVATGLFGNQETFVPIALTHIDHDEVVADAPRDMIKDAPRIEADRELSVEDQRMLYRYYRDVFGGTRQRQNPSQRDRREQPEQRGDAMTDREARHDAGAGGQTGRMEEAGGQNEAADGRPGTDNAMTRSEEEVHIGKNVEETGHVQLKKYIVTDKVTMDVPVAHEEVRLEREPITDENREAALRGPELKESEHDVTLHAERPVVDKKVVPKERVRLDKDVVRDNRPVNETVRKERIDMDEADENRH